MGWFSKLFSSAATDPIKAVGNILDDLFTSDEEKLNIEVIKQRLAQRPALAQVEVNKAQAGHRSMFVAGARPFLMWVCGVGLGMAFIINPLLEFYTDGKEVINIPTGVIMELVLAMLGLSTLRTVEKLSGKAK